MCCPENIHNTHTLPMHVFFCSESPHASSVPVEIPVLGHIFLSNGALETPLPSVIFNNPLGGGYGYFLEPHDASKG